MKRSRNIALAMAMVVSLTACGGNEAAPASGETSAATAAETQMGRWVENEVDLGGREIAGFPALLDDGSLVMYVYEQDPTTFVGSANIHGQWGKLDGGRSRLERAGRWIHQPSLERAGRYGLLGKRSEGRKWPCRESL